MASWCYARRNGFGEQMSRYMVGKGAYGDCIRLFSDLFLTGSAFDQQLCRVVTYRGRHLGKELTMAKGTVKWFNTTKGFGFIAPEQGSQDVFVHATALERAGIHRLDDGQAVTFELETDRNGRSSATSLALA